MALINEILTIIRDLPAHHFEKIPNMIPEIGKIIPKGKSVQEFLIEVIQKRDITAIEAIYNPLSLFLAAGGCFGGPVGIAFNAVDAAFCYMLKNTLGLVIDLLSIVVVFPGAKAGLTSISKAISVLPGYIGKYLTTGIALKAIKRVLARAKTAGQFTEDMVKDLYFICKPYIKDITELQNYIYLHHRKAFELIVEELKRLGKGSNVAETAKGVGYGMVDVGKKLQLTAREISKGVEKMYGKFTPQSQINPFK